MNGTNRNSAFCKAVADFERDFLYRELSKRNWNRRRTAEEMGISYRALRYKIDTLGLIDPCRLDASPELDNFLNSLN